MTFEDKIEVALEGRWRDEFVDAVTGETLWHSGWNKNQIQNSGAVLVASLLRRQEEFSGNPYKGISYVAVGSGDVGWDAVPPVLSKAATTLLAETYRKAVAPTDLAFITAFNGQESNVPTRFVRCVVTFLANQANFTLREFAVFGGTAGAVQDSGAMLNWVRHPRIDKTADIVLIRTIEFEIKEPV